MWISLWLGGVECLVTDPHMTSVPIEDGLSSDGGQEKFLLSMRPLLTALQRGGERTSH